MGWPRQSSTTNQAPIVSASSYGVLLLLLLATTGSLPLESVVADGAVAAVQRVVSPPAAQQAGLNTPSATRKVVEGHDKSAGVRKAGFITNESRNASALRTSEEYHDRPTTCNATVSGGCAEIQDLPITTSSDRASHAEYPLSSVTPYEFSSDWFSSNIPIWSQLLKPFRGAPVTFMEIGSFEGRSATWLLDNILTHPEARLFCVDPFLPSFGFTAVAADMERTYHRFRRNMRRHEGKYSLLKGYSHDVLKLPEVSAMKFDFFYIDGNHFPQMALEDAVLAFRLLKDGGVMVFDDYKWVGAKGDYSPKSGIDAFVYAYRPLIDVLFSDYQYIIKKKPLMELAPAFFAHEASMRIAEAERKLEKKPSLTGEEELKALRLHYAVELNAIKKPQVAIVQADKVLEKDKANAMAYRNKVHSYLLLGERQAALDTLALAGESLGSHRFEAELGAVKQAILSSSAPTSQPKT